MTKTSGGCLKADQSVRCAALSGFPSLHRAPPALDPRPSNNNTRACSFHHHRHQIPLQRATLPIPASDWHSTTPQHCQSHTRTSARRLSSPSRDTSPRSDTLTYLTQLLLRGHNSPAFSRKDYYLPPAKSRRYLRAYTSPNQTFSPHHHVGKTRSVSR